MIADARFRTNSERLRHVEECEAPIAAFIAARTLDEVMAVFHNAEITATPVYEIDQLLEGVIAYQRGDFDAAGELIASHPDVEQVYREAVPWADGSIGERARRDLAPGD